MIPRHPLIWRDRKTGDEALLMVDTVRNLSRHAKYKRWKFKSDRTKFGGHWVDPDTRDTYYIDEMSAIKRLRGPERAKGWRPSKNEEWWSMKGSENDVVRMVVAGPAEKEVERLFKAILPGSPFAHKAYAVGGYVRDEMLGVESKDVDMVVEMRGGAEKLTKWLHRMFPTETSRPRQMRNYPIWTLAFKDDVEYKGDEYKTRGGDVEVADTQKESFPDEDSRARVTEPGTLEEDTRRRDFTVNMLLKDLTSGEIVDLTGTSVKDLERGVLRGHPGVDLNKIFRDDPLRMLRLVRFQAKYGWDVPLDVLKTVRKNAKRIEIVSAERIRDELIKVMKLGKLSRAVKFMKAVGLLGYVFPEIQALQGVEHDTSRGHHQEGDVYRHTMLVLKSAKPGVESQLAALLHDIGKPATQEYIGDKIQFLGHENVGAEMAEVMMRRMRFDKDVVRTVKMMVENHMRPHSLGRKDAKAKALRKFVRHVGEEMVEAILDLAEADSLGNLPPRNYVPELREKIDEAMAVPVREKSVLDGRDIMEMLGVRQGPKVGLAIQYVKDLEDEYAARGEVLDRDDAERLLRKKFLV